MFQPLEPIFPPLPPQESSFQPAGAANTIPSESYDFFAPLGEFGQPRRHYHQMRLLHHTIEAYDDLLATMPNGMPNVTPSSYSDVTTPRWAVRSNGTSGLVFFNNYQRLTEMPRKDGVQFSLTNAAQGLPDLVFPQTPVSVAANSWFAWPFRFPVAAGLLHVESASAQVCPWAKAWVTGHEIHRRSCQSCP